MIVGRDKPDATYAPSRAIDDGRVRLMSETSRSVAVRHETAYSKPLRLAASATVLILNTRTSTLHMYSDSQWMPS